MKTYLIICLIPLLLAACSSSKKVSSGSSTNNQPATGTVTTTSPGDGSSFETAIVIDAKSETTGVDKEYAWLKKNYPGYKLLEQGLSFDNNNPYDVMSIKTKDGIEKKIYFDISNFFGKF